MPDCVDKEYKVTLAHIHTVSCSSTHLGKLTRWHALLHTCLYSLALDSEWYPAPESKKEGKNVFDYS